MGGGTVPSRVHGEPLRDPEDDDPRRETFGLPRFYTERWTRVVQDLFREVPGVAVCSGEGFRAGSLVGDSEDDVSVTRSAVGEADCLVDEDFDGTRIRIASRLVGRAFAEVYAVWVFLEIQGR